VFVFFFFWSPIRQTNMAMTLNSNTKLLNFIYEILTFIASYLFFEKLFLYIYSRSPNLPGLYWISLCSFVLHMLIFWGWNILLTYLDVLQNPVELYKLKIQKKSSQWLGTTQKMYFTCSFQSIGCYVAI